MTQTPASILVTTPRAKLAWGPSRGWLLGGQIIGREAAAERTDVLAAGYRPHLVRVSSLRGAPWPSRSVPAARSHHAQPRSRPPASLVGSLAPLNEPSIIEPRTPDRPFLGAPVGLCSAAPL